MKLAFCGGRGGSNYHRFSAMPTVLAHAHRCEQSLADPAILWQGVSVLIFADCLARSIAAHAVNRTMIVASSSETELDFANHRVGISSAALVNSFIVRIVSVTVRIIAVGIVPVVWIRIIKKRIPKIAKEEEPIVEVSMAEPITAKTMVAKTITVKATAKTTAAKTTTVKGTAKASTSKTTTGKASTSKTATTEAAAVKASSTEAAATMTTTAAAMRHHA
jgi:hypothetical protein